MRKRLTMVILIALMGGTLAAQQKRKVLDSDLMRETFLAWNSHDPDKVISFYTDDAVYEDVAYGEVSHGKAEFRKFAAGFFEAVPDLKVEVVSASAHNGRGSLEWVFSGTDKGLYKTGKRFSVRGASLFEMRGGKCSANKDFYDLATIMRQLGVLTDKPA